MTNEQLYERHLIKPEWRDQDGLNSYQLNIHASERNSPFACVVELVIDGNQVNPSGESQAFPGHKILRAYDGLNKRGADEICRLVDKSHYYFSKGSVSLGTLIRYIDNRIVGQQESCGVELTLVEES